MKRSGNRLIEESGNLWDRGGNTPARRMQNCAHRGGPCGQPVHCGLAVHKLSYRAGMVRHSPLAAIPDTLFMRFTARSFRPTLPGAARLAAIVAAAAAIGVWGAVLLAPSPSRLPPAVAAAPVRQSNVEPVALWFGRDGVLQTQIAVLGLIAQGSNGAAVVSVNGGPPTALAVGQTAAPGIVLAGVDAQGVILDANGTRTRVAAPPFDAVPGGIVPVR